MEFLKNEDLIPEYLKGDNHKEEYLKGLISVLDNDNDKTNQPNKDKMLFSIDPEKQFIDITVSGKELIVSNNFNSVTQDDLEKLLFFIVNHRVYKPELGLFRNRNSIEYLYPFNKRELTRGVAAESNLIKTALYFEHLWDNYEPIYKLTKHLLIKFNISYSNIIHVWRGLNLMSKTFFYADDEDWDFDIRPTGDLYISPVWSNELTEIATLNVMIDSLTRKAQRTKQRKDAKTVGESKLNFDTTGILEDFAGKKEKAPLEIPQGIGFISSMEIENLELISVFDNKGTDRLHARKMLENKEEGTWKFKDISETTVKKINEPGFNLSEEEAEKILFFIVNIKKFVTLKKSNGELSEEEEIPTGLLHLDTGVKLPFTRNSNIVRVFLTIDFAMPDKKRTEVYIGLIKEIFLLLNIKPEMFLTVWKGLQFITKSPKRNTNKITEAVFEYLVSKMSQGGSRSGTKKQTKPRKKGGSQTKPRKKGGSQTKTRKKIVRLLKKKRTLKKTIKI